MKAGTVRAGTVKEWGTISEHAGKIEVTNFSIDGGSTTSPFTDEKARALVIISVIERLQKELDLMPEDGPAEIEIG